MRGKRAKLLHQMALEDPAKFQGGFYNKTFIRGGVARRYRDLKREWRQRGIMSWGITARRTDSV